MAPLALRRIESAHARADMSIQDKDGETALMVAAGKGRIDAVKALIEAGADVNAKNSEGKTALDVAKSDEVKAILQQALGK